jgi:hypothetical protein
LRRGEIPVDAIAAVAPENDLLAFGADTRVAAAGSE